MVIFLMLRQFIRVKHLKTLICIFLIYFGHKLENEQIFLLIPNL